MSQIEKICRLSLGRWMTINDLQRSAGLPRSQIAKLIRTICERWPECLRVKRDENGRLLSLRAGFVPRLDYRQHDCIDLNKERKQLGVQFAPECFPIL